LYFSACIEDKRTTRRRKKRRRGSGKRKRKRKRNRRRESSRCNETLHYCSGATMTSVYV
jgi:hypothetical protein